MNDDAQLANALENLAHPLEGGKDDYTPLLDRIAGARFVLLGEASHGTHEFYRARSEITKRLIREKGFDGMVVEADWPDAYRANRWVRGHGTDADAEEALAHFHRRFPTWMWRNGVALDLLGWLRAHNETHPSAQVGFYGFDVYSLQSSIEAVLGYLETHDDALGRQARQRYGCFENFGENTQAYAYRVATGMSLPCEDDVIAQLEELRRNRARLVARDGPDAEDAYFDAEQNARVVLGAERYYRSMFGPRNRGWNLRDTHMVDTVDALSAHLSARLGRPAKLVIWAHNSHLGDARATELGAGAGQLNVGQLMRERHGTDAFLVGFTTHSGTVSAASDWDAPVERKRIRPALDGSYEALFHLVNVPRFLLDLRDLGEAAGQLREVRLERAIGVVYLPATERLSHYFHALLPSQFDAVLHFDESRALEPLERSPLWVTGEMPDTYPSAL